MKVNKYLSAKSSSSSIFIKNNKDKYYDSKFMCMEKRMNKKELTNLRRP